MSDDKTKDAAAEAKAMTAAQAAKAVRRPATVVDGKAVKTDEVLSFRDYGTHVVVVTTDGQKLNNAAE